MRTTVFVSELELSARVGVHAYEQGRTQTLGFDIEAVVETPDIDDLSATVDYSAMVGEIHSVLASGHIILVETVAHHIASGILAMPGVLKVSVRVTKPGAIVGTKKVGVTVSGVRPTRAPAPAMPDPD